MVADTGVYPSKNNQGTLDLAGIQGVNTLIVIQISKRVGIRDTPQNELSFSQIAKNCVHILIAVKMI